MMRFQQKINLFIVFQFITCIGFAQSHRLLLRVTGINEKHRGDSLYVAGNFNNWNPGDSLFRLTRNGENYELLVPNLREDVYQFKFTRGNWEKGETGKAGKGMENRLIKLVSDTVLECVVADWQDDYPPEPKKNTASAHVELMDSAFFMPQLNRSRKIWIYLPEGYRQKKNKQRYPVIYMQDGQNLFNELTSGYGEWGVDECLDSMIRNGKRACIVIGVECGPKRMTEYNPYDFEEFGKGEGIQYVDFLANTLKPYVDKHFRTMPGKETTVIAGSSMGGLISYYALLSHPNVFGTAGVFSPAFWTAPVIKQLTEEKALKTKGKIFFYAGELEGGKMVSDMEEVADSIGKKSSAIIYAVIDPDGRHNEQAWRKWFAEFYSWSFINGFNGPVRIEK